MPAPGIAKRRIRKQLGSGTTRGGTQNLTCAAPARVFLALAAKPTARM